MTDDKFDDLNEIEDEEEEEEEEAGRSQTLLQRRLKQ